jgi:hypothetical protein
MQHRGQFRRETLAQAAAQARLGPIGALDSDSLRHVRMVEWRPVQPARKPALGVGQRLGPELSAAEQASHRIGADALADDDVGQHQRARRRRMFGPVQPPAQAGMPTQDAVHGFRDGMPVLGADIAALAKIGADRCVGGALGFGDLGKQFDRGLQAGGGSHRGAAGGCARPLLTVRGGSSARLP